MLAISSERLSISSRIAWVTALASPPGSGVAAVVGVPEPARLRLRLARWFDCWAARRGRHGRDGGEERDADRVA